MCRIDKRLRNILDVNGKVIHVVQRPPPMAAFASNNTQSTATNNSAPFSRRADTHTGTMYLGAMAFPSDFMETGGKIFSCLNILPPPYK